MADQPLTAQQVVSLLGTVMFKLASADVARNALLSGLSEAGLEELAPLVLKVKPPAGSDDAGEGKKSQKRKRGKGGNGEDGNETDSKKRSRKPRGLTLMNLFTPFIFEMIHKDPAHPAFKLPTKTNEQGNQVQARGGQMTLASSCWTSMTDPDKTRFGELVGPFMKLINDAIAADEGRPEHVHDKLKAFLAEKKHDKEVNKIIQRAIEASTGFNPTKPATNGTAPPGSASKGTIAKPAAAKPMASTAGVGGAGKAAGKELATALKAADGKKAKLEAAKKQKEEERKKVAAMQQADDDDDDSDDDDDDDDE